MELLHVLVDSRSGMTRGTGLPSVCLRCAGHCDHARMRQSLHPTINFAVLLRRIEPTAAEVLNAKLHRATVRARLSASFDVVKLLPIGSHARGTAIRGYSDFDVMAVLRRNVAKWGGAFILSSTLLRKIRQDLQSR